MRSNTNDTDEFTRIGLAAERVMQRLFEKLDDGVDKQDRRRAEQRDTNKDADVAIAHGWLRLGNKKARAQVLAAVSLPREVDGR